MKPSSYTCREYRQEMLLIALRRQVQDENLTPEEKRSLIERIQALEKEMDME